jgi:hypothetical protein
LIPYSPKEQTETYFYIKKEIFIGILFATNGALKLIIKE